MSGISKQIRKNLTVLLFSSLFTTTLVHAAIDIEAQEGVARARAKNFQKGVDHSAHSGHLDKSLEFHGVFYGYVPCSDCDGIKMTLSLKQKNNYLLVTQPAKESSREFYERGKYRWDDEKRVVELEPKKGGNGIKRYRIENEGTLVELTDDGLPKQDFVLKRSDTVKSREVHIH